MRDLKQKAGKRVKANRRKQERQPVDWRRLLHTSVRLIIATGTGTLLVSGAVLTAEVLRESGYFNVSQIRVEHNLRVSEGEILEASDIRIGDSLFDLDLFMIGARIEEHPWIARAELERIFPDNLAIRVVEREPRAIIDLDYLYYVDAAGEVFKVLEPRDDLDFPVLTGIDRQALLADDSTTRDWLRKALALLSELERRSLFNLDQVSEIHYDRRQGLVLYTGRHGVPVLLGEDDFVGKLDRFERVYPELEPRLTALAYIDLNVADRVIVKKIDAGQLAGQTLTTRRGA
ncbi:MAG: FtsQ-type POTRA domain-containing protein [Desulfuromonadales bacterium]|nr:FtsQ-type POTRA domain-containing protein [Desulfuromonadales bacterium]